MTHVQELETMLTRTITALGEASQQSPEHAVEVGTALWNALSQGQDLLDTIKIVLREQAREQNVEKGGHIYLDGAHKGLCQVIVPKTLSQLKKGADIDNLEEMLGPKFEHLFKVRETVTVKKEAMGRIADLAPDLKIEVLNAIEQVDPKPRVVFTEKKSWQKNT